MNTNNSSGRTFCILIGIWLLFKTVLNTFINGIHISDLPQDARELIIAIAVCVFLFLGIKYSNYIIAGVLAFIVIYYLPGNIDGLGNSDSLVRSLIYILEGGVDIVCALVLCLASNVKEHFTNKFSDISGR